VVSVLAPNGRLHFAELGPPLVKVDEPRLGDRHPEQGGLGAQVDHLHAAVVAEQRQQ
jgi:hypothetical protein